MKDRWIIGTSPAGEREYIVHNVQPQFWVRVLEMGIDARKNEKHHIMNNGDILQIENWLSDVNKDDIMEMLPEAEAALEEYKHSVGSIH